MEFDIMKRIIIILTIVLTIAILSVLLSMDGAANEQDPQETDVVIPSESLALQETDVAITSKYWYHIGNGQIKDGGSSELAPTYHDTFITAEDNGIIFHNYVRLHDERVSKDKWEVKFYMTVYEVIDGELTLIHHEGTGGEIWQPPTEMMHYQTAMINVDYTGAGTHTFSVGSEYEIYKIKKDGEKLHSESPSYFESAYVQEVLQLSEPTNSLAT